jgi:hypothetical protein
MRDSDSTDGPYGTLVLDERVPKGARMRDSGKVLPFQKAARLAF